MFSVSSIEIMKLFIIEYYSHFIQVIQIYASLLLLCVARHGEANCRIYEAKNLEGKIRGANNSINWLDMQVTTIANYFSNITIDIDCGK